MKRIIITIAMTAAISFSGLAQSIIGLPTDGQFSAYRPSSLGALNDEKELKALTSRPYGQTANTNKIWVAYSDRDNNALYSDPQGRNKRTETLSLNEVVVIAKIDQSTGYALVYTNAGQESRLAIGDRKPKGWIKMDNLLLWKDAPCHNGIANKAVICANAKYTQDPKTLLKCFSSPAGSASLDDNITNGFTFYYVMKQVGTRVLLAKYQHLSSGVSDNGLYGWVDRNSYLPWNQRTCFETEYHENKISKLKGLNLKEYSFRSGSNVYKVPFTGKRMTPEMLRYPIFDDSTPSTLHCSYFEAPEGFDLGSFNAAKQKLEGMIKKYSTAHIGIVIDGTKSMGPYFPAAKDALLAGCNYLSGEFKPTIDILIYRDDKDGKYLSELKTGFKDPKSPELKSFLDKAGEYGANSAKNDTDMEESLYYGINKALEEFKFNPGQANLLIVIGDCGDNGRPTKIDPKQLSASMIANNVNIVGVQVRNTTGKAFQDYQSEVIDLVYNTTVGRYEKTLGKSSKTFKPSTTDKDGKTIPGFDWNTGYDLFVGRYRGAEAGKTFDTAKTTDVLKEIFLDWAKAITGYKKDLEDLKLGNISANNQNNEILKKQIGEAAFEALCKAGGFAAIDSQTQTKQSSFDLWSYTLLLEAKEYNEVLKKLKPVYEASIAGDASSNTRAQYVDAMKALVLALTGGNAQDIGRMTNEDIMKMLFGINIKRPGITEYTLDEIIDKKKVSDDKFLELASRMELSYSQLQKYYKSSTYKNKVNDQNTIFWVPLEYIP